MYRYIYNKGDSSHLLANPYLEPLVVLAVVVRDDVHQLEVEHADDDQAVDDPIFGELQAGVPVLVWKNKIA